MTQPILETNFTRALRLLGLRPASRRLSTPLSVQSVQIIADVGDVSIPHSNPIFGGSIGVTAVIAEHAGIEILATSRLLRIRIISQTGFTDPRIFVQQALYIDNAQAAAEVRHSLGPGVDAPTAIIVRGTSTQAPVGGEYTPQVAQFDLRPPLLIAPSFRLVIADRTVNTAPTPMGFIWEEIPEQEAQVGVGFPTIAES